MFWPIERPLPPVSLTQRRLSVLLAVVASLLLHAWLVLQAPGHAAHRGSVGWLRWPAEGSDRDPRRFGHAERPTVGPDAQGAPVWALRIEPAVVPAAEASVGESVAPHGSVTPSGLPLTQSEGPPAHGSESAAVREVPVAPGQEPASAPSPVQAWASSAPGAVAHPAAVGPAAAGGPAAATDVPPSFQQRLRVRRGAHTGWADWTWHLENGRYQARLAGRLHGPGAPPALDWHSQGGLDGQGVAPERYVARAARGGARAVNFERDTARISFSGPTGQHPLPAAAQDRLSWLVQLMALVRARAHHPAGLSLGDRFELWVAGPQGDAGVWSFRIEGLPPDGSVQLGRAALRRFDLQVRVQLGPVPERRLLRLTMHHEGGSQAPWEFSDALSGYGTEPAGAPNPLPTIPP